MHRLPDMCYIFCVWSAIWLTDLLLHSLHKAMNNWILGHKCGGKILIFYLFLVLPSSSVFIHFKLSKSSAIRAKHSTTSKRKLKRQQDQLYQQTRKYLLQQYLVLSREHFQVTETWLQLQLVRLEWLRFEPAASVYNVSDFSCYCFYEKNS